MTKKLKITLLVTVFTALVLTNPIFSSPVYKSIDVVYNNIKIFIDDVQYTPKDANGEVVEPFMYNGTVYLPIRAVGDAFNKSVSWDGRNNYVYLGGGGGRTSADTTPVSSRTFLDELTYFSYRKFNIPTAKWTEGKYELWSAKDKTSDGGNYIHCVKLTTAGAENVRLDFLLNQKYTEFTATAMVHDISKNIACNGEEYYCFKIFLDDSYNPAYTHDFIAGGDIPQKINLDVTGAIKMTFQLEGKTGLKAFSYVVTNPILMN